MPQNISSSFVKPNNPILLKIAEEIPVNTIQSSEVKSIIKSLLHVALGEQMDQAKPILVGLAAPQVGISKRIILVDIKADGKGVKGDLRVFINPVILSSSDKRSEWYEGCFSTGRVCGIVARPDTITVKYFTPEGKSAVATYKGYTARIFQHEIDHLNGKEFVTHIDDPSKLHWVEDSDFVEYRNNEKWRTWKKLCPKERWLQIKNSAE